MEFNDLLRSRDIPADGVLVMRHRPTEPGLRKALPWLAEEKPDVFNAYQQTQTPRAEQSLLKAKYLASFIGSDAGRATFAGLYKVGSTKRLDGEQFRKIPAYKLLKTLGHIGFTGKRPSVLWFDMEPTEFYSDWKGRLIVDWPPPERAWVRWSINNKIFINAILEESQFSKAIPEWFDLVLTWDELQLIPTTLRQRLMEWRGIYLIYDIEQKKAYVGSAYGKENLLGRWLNYGKTAHGGNKLLRSCNPSSLRFSILQRLSPDLDAKDVFDVEVSWKKRLHTREFGLNLN